MPKVKANNIEINYDEQGEGEPIILIPYLAAEQACYAFQVADYAKRFTCIQSLADFVRGRPAQQVDAFMRQSNAVLGHDALACLGSIQAPTQMTFGRYDMVCSTRFADRMTGGIKDSELVIFEGAAHAAIYEKVEDFNAKTLAFLQRHSA